MKTFRNIEKLPQIEGSVVTIGNFDGIHLGHQKIIAQLKEHAEKLKVPSVVIHLILHHKIFLVPIMQFYRAMKKKISFSVVWELTTT